MTPFQGPHGPHGIARARAKARVQAASAASPAGCDGSPRSRLARRRQTALPAGRRPLRFGIRRPAACGRPAAGSAIQFFLRLGKTAPRRFDDSDRPGFILSLLANLFDMEKQSRDIHYICKTYLCGPISLFRFAATAACLSTANIPVS